VRLGRLQININPKPPKIDRQLELDYFATFKTGENLYTYPVDSLARISGRYLDQVKSTLNFMLQYSAGPKQVETFANNIERKLMQAIEEPHPQKRLDHVIEAREISKQMPKLQDYVESLELKRWHDLYTMFFVLDGEPECLFSPKWNKKKIALLEAEDDEFQEAIFFFLETLLIHFSDTYKQDTLNSMLQERELVELANSLSSITSIVSQNTRSKSANGMESILKDSGT